MKPLPKSLCVFSLVLAFGCGNQPADTPNDPQSAPPANTAAAHNHADHGPHGGELIELGNEDYHAELLHDAGSVTIYILGSDATKAVPIDATEVTINLTHDGQPEQFQLAADPDQGDPQGKSSRFVSKDAELAKLIEEEGTQAKLVVIISGTTYRGDVVHDHAAAGHVH